MIRAVIIEDERPILELMKIIINKNKHLDIIGEFTDPNEALESIEQLLPDVIFIDVEMPCMNGIELAKEVMRIDENIQIVFVSAYEKYALGAFQVNAVNYILKPITEEELNITVNRLLKNYNARKSLLTSNKKNKIYSLGRFKVYGDLEKEIKWPTIKVQELVAYFIYSEGEEIDKWHLCDILWTDSPPKKAEHNLHSAIYRLKTAFRDGGIEDIVSYEKGKYRIDLNDFYCDAWEFETFIKNNPLVNEKNIVNYEKIIDLYKGVLFGSEDYLWTIELNEKFDRYYVNGVKNIAKYYMKNKSYNKAEEYLKKAVKKDPFDEEAHELIMQVYSHVRQKIRLVSYYNNLNKLLKEELDIEPKESTKKLYKTLLMNL